MIDLPIKAEVFCSDGPAGRSTYIIGKPVDREVTRLVVKSYLPPFHEYAVPVDQVQETHDHRIILKCTRNELTQMQPFESEEYVPTQLPAYLLSSDVPDVPATPWATMQPVNTFVRVKHQNIPSEETVLRHGARVEATDGYVGQVGELWIDSNTMQVTHLVVHAGHLLTERKLTIPVAQVDHTDEDVIQEKLPVQQSARYPKKLPTFSDALSLVKETLLLQHYFPTSVFRMHVRKTNRVRSIYHHSRSFHTFSRVSLG